MSRDDKIRLAVATALLVLGHAVGLGLTFVP
jgi:hypothetical protein